MKKLLILLSVATVLYNCNTSRQTATTVTEVRDLDTMVISAPRTEKVEESYELPVYHASATREFDLIHTRLDVRFNWEKEQVLGKASLTLKPYFYPSDKVTLDAKNFVFHKVTYQGSETPLKYDYDGMQITVHLNKEVTRTDTIKLFFDYTATPTPEGGSAAIGSDRGLYFINPRGDDGDKPQQIWTQGETESNSRWFPTIDKPNERTTQEILVTVDDRFSTLSNGLMISSVKNDDGTRTDHWKMDLPHAPYLFMLAIGEYAVVKDSWEGIPVNYYVEPEYRESAKDIFPHTPEMLTFFSNILNVKYPWPKFSQVIVRDFVSGAMENTTAVIFGDFIQKHSQELADDDDLNEKIVAHEMFHHWFGDLVTCESWSNLTLNEGFANYSEYLWMEHKHGVEEADFHLLQERKGYMASAQKDIHDLINFSYNDKEEMFDAHSYNKGGLILHMLRHYVGDEAFFTALNTYLTRNAFTDVEAHELRLAFEDITGEDLNWFFNQWFYSQGHPVLDISSDYSAETGMVTVTVEQQQDPTRMPPIFQLPVAIDIYESPDKVRRENVMVNERKQTFSFKVDQKPQLVNFDAEKMLLAEKHESKSTADYIFQYYNAPKFMDRYEAINALSFERPDERIYGVYKKALDDSNWVLRLAALDLVNMEDVEVLKKAENMVAHDLKPHVRAKALEKIAETGDAKYLPVVKKALEKEKSLLVKGAALKALLQLDSEEALKQVKNLENESSADILDAIADIYLNSGKAEHLAFFEKSWTKMTGFSGIDFFSKYTALAIKNPSENIMQAANFLNNVAADTKTGVWHRYGAVKALNDLHVELATRALDESPQKEKLSEQDEKVKAMIEALKAAESNMQLKMMFAGFPSKIKRP